MKKVIIGSTALKHYFPNYKREPKDLDYATSIYKKSNVKDVEYLYNPIITEIENRKYLRPEYLLSLKISHLNWETNWDKHLFHVQFLLKQGVKYDIKLIERLKLFWKEFLPTIRSSNLKLNSKEFFNNAINVKIPHDDIHKLIVKIPTYMKILKDNCEVEPCEIKFNNLSHKEKLELVREEIYVMAWERYRNLDYREAYRIMLQKFIMNHAPRFEFYFIIENYIELLIPPFNYIKHINNELSKI